MGNQQANGQGAPLGSAPPRPTSAQEEAERQQRANALQNRIEKKQPKKKSVQEIKAEHWKAYKSIDGSTATAAGHANSPSTSSTGYRLADGARVSSNSSSPTNAHSQYQPPTMRSAASIPTTSTSTSTSSSTSTSASSQPTLKSSSSSSVLAQPAHPLEARAQARVFKKKDDPSSKWKTYEQLDALSQQQATSQQSHIERHAQEITSSESDRKYVSVREAQAAGVLPTSTPTTTPSIQQTEMDPHFKMQMESLLQQAQTMPIASLDLIRKMLGNLNKPSPDDKFRRVKLSNDKIQQSIVNVPGAIELLLAVGFEVDALMLPSPTSTDIIEEDYLVWRDTHQNQSVVAIAIQQLDQLLASRKS